MNCFFDLHEVHVHLLSIMTQCFSKNHNWNIYIYIYIMENNILGIKICFYCTPNESNHHQVFQIEILVNDGFIIFLWISLCKTYSFDPCFIFLANMVENVLNSIKSEAIARHTKLWKDTTAQWFACVSNLNIVYLPIDYIHLILCKYLHEYIR